MEQENKNNLIPKQVAPIPATKEVSAAVADYKYAIAMGMLSFIG